MAAKIKSFVVGELQSNSYLLAGRYLIDAGGLSGELKEALLACRDSFEAVLLTHAHVDHIAGILEIKQLLPECKVYCHRSEKKFLADPKLNLSVWLGKEISVEADGTFDEYSPAIEGEKLQVIETPGHTPGGVCFYWQSEGLLFSGDTLFKNGVGRTDLYGGDMGTLQNSIKSKLFTLPVGTTVFPGHGPQTIIGDEVSG
ncbi:MAG: MBL fold metallo-hydrolase [bacterium]